MNPNRVRTRGLEFRQVSGARLENYSLFFNKMSKDHDGIGHANIQYQKGDRVEGVLYELTQTIEIDKMDLFERAPINYGREVIQVSTGSQQIWAWTYFANKALIRDGLDPTAEYLEHLLTGKPYLSEDYWLKLQQQSVANGPNG